MPEMWRERNPQANASVYAQQSAYLQISNEIEAIRKDFTPPKGSLAHDSLTSFEPEFDRLMARQAPPRSEPAGRALVSQKPLSGAERLYAYTRTGKNEDTAWWHVQNNLTNGVNYKSAEYLYGFPPYKPEPPRGRSYVKPAQAPSPVSNPISNSRVMELHANASDYLTRRKAGKAAQDAVLPALSRGLGGAVPATALTVWLFPPAGAAMTLATLGVTLGQVLVSTTTSTLVATSVDQWKTINDPSTKFAKISPDELEKDAEIDKRISQLESYTGESAKTSTSTLYSLYRGTLLESAGLEEAFYERGPPKAGGLSKDTDRGDLRAVNRDEINAFRLQSEIFLKKIEGLVSDFRTRREALRKECDRRVESIVEGAAKTVKNEADMAVAQMFKTKAECVASEQYLALTEVRWLAFLGSTAEKSCNTFLRSYRLSGLAVESTEKK